MNSCVFNTSGHSIGEYDGSYVFDLSLLVVGTYTDGYVQNESGHSIGSYSDDGLMFDNSGNQVGNCTDDGYIHDNSGNTIGQYDGDIEGACATALLLLF